MLQVCLDSYSSVILTCNSFAHPRTSRALFLIVKHLQQDYTHLEVNDHLYLTSDRFFFTSSSARPFTNALRIISNVADSNRDNSFHDKRTDSLVVRVNGLVVALV